LVLLLVAAATALPAPAPGPEAGAEPDPQLFYSSLGYSPLWYNYPTFFPYTQYYHIPYVVAKKSEG
ncbi:hypothetical protein Hamer_G007168, partial [Homarus americanus]